MSARRGQTCLCQWQGHVFLTHAIIDHTTLLAGRSLKPWALTYRRFTTNPVSKLRSTAPFTQNHIRTHIPANAMASSVPHSDEVKSQPICIVGAGPAGLITAQVLLQDGFQDVQVLCKDATVGGV